MFIPEAEPGLPVPPITHRLIHAPGVFFNLSDTEYHKALALSASGIKNLRISTLDWWARSPLNPQQPTESDTESFAKTVGKAYHKRILEGRAAFTASYAAEVDPADHPNALRSNDELSRRCADLGLKASGRKADLILRILEADPEHIDVIWERIVAAHERKHAGKIFLPSDLISKIEISAKMIEAHPELRKAFSGGFPEVSVFWTDEETGVPCKARFDYLKPQAIVDLKTFENMMGMPVERAIARAVAVNKYHIQAAFYVEAFRQAQRIKRASLEGLPADLAGAKPDPFLRAFLATDEPVFMFVFQQKGIAPLARGKILPHGMTMDIGRQEAAVAKDTFARCWATFGPDAPWVDIAEITSFDSTDFPAFIAD